MMARRFLRGNEVVGIFSSMTVACICGKRYDADTLASGSRRMILRIQVRLDRGLYIVGFLGVN